MLFGRKRRDAAAAERRATRPVFETRGWQWQDAAPPPTMEITEATLRGRRGYDAIWPTGMSEVVSARVEGHDATVARLVGYEFGTTRSGTPFGERRETNVVWMRLPAVLPEIRFGDATLRARDDQGIRLPPLPRSPAGPSTRWSVEGFIPSFAADLLTPGFVAMLESAPERTPVVIRAGVILTYGAGAMDVASVDARLALLAELIRHVPAASWGRADALVAGTGVFPRDIADGVALRLDERLVARDWKGYGLQKVDWRDTPTAEGSVMLRHREAHDVWERTAPGPNGITVGIRFGGKTLVRSRQDTGIPTVISTLPKL